jgi:hypothetical protein
MNSPIKITVMFPTRGRPASLERSLQTLLDRTSDISSIEILLGIDRDDQDTIDHCLNTIKPWLESLGCQYKFLQFDRQGYAYLHRYINELAKHARGDWLFFYNDDAAMETADWDKVILEHSQEFCLLRAETNHEHPYAIFPILPRKWIHIIGYFSQHQLNDAWVSQIGWMLDIVKTIPVMITHERFDLTGENKDSTFQEREIFENNPNDPRDFNHVDLRKVRFNDAVKLADYLEKTHNRDMSWFKDAVQGKHDVWQRMLAMDKKGLMKKWR